MRRFSLLTALLLAGCAFSPDLPKLPGRGELPLSTAIDRAYEDVLAAPADPAANGDLAMALHRFEDFLHAEIFYQRARILAPEEFRWLYYTGAVQISQNKYSPAMATLRRALTVNPEYLPARVRLLRIAFRTGSLAECEQQSRELLSRPEVASLAAYWLGRSLVKRGRYEEAIEHLRNACESYPDFGAAHSCWGYASSQLADQRTAREQFRLADQHRFQAPSIDDPLLAAIGPDFAHPNDLLLRAYKLELQGNYKEAGRLYRRLLHLDPRSVEAASRLIRIATAEGKYEEAHAHWEAVMGWDDRQADAHTALGLLLLRQKRFQEARTAFERALNINPYQPEALANLGHLMDKYEQGKEAERLFRMAIDIRPGYRDAHLYLGALLVDSGRASAAAKEFAAVTAVQDGRTPELLYQLSAIYVRAGDRRRAFECLRRAHELARQYGQMSLADRIEKENRFF